MIIIYCYYFKCRNSYSMHGFIYTNYDHAVAVLLQHPLPVDLSFPTRVWYLLEAMKL